MNKLILKTTVITLASVIIALVLSLSAMVFFAPKLIGSLFDGLGMYSASVFFYEKQYQKSEDIHDLALLIDKLDKDEDLEKSKLYLTEIVESEEFSSFCQMVDENKTVTVTSNEYYYLLLTQVVYLADGFEESVSVALEYVEKFSYTAFNPIRIIISDYGQTLQEQQLHQLKGVIEQKLPSLSAEQTVFANYDLNDIQTLLSEK